MPAFFVVRGNRVNRSGFKGLPKTAGLPSGRSESLLILNGESGTCERLRIVKVIQVLKFRIVQCPKLLIWL
jgi:hypothetical protein